MKHIRGYTLIEIFITLSILIIVLFFIVKNYNTFLLKKENEIMRQTFIRLFHQARNEAMNRGTPVILCPTENEQTCTTRWGNRYILLADHEVIHTVHFKKVNGSLSWSSFPANLKEIEFLPSGRSRFQNGTLRFYPFNTNKPSWMLVLNQIGRVRSVDEAVHFSEG